MFNELPRFSIAVLGSGPRALASAVCLSRHHSVTLGESGGYCTQQQLARAPLYPTEPKLDELLGRTSGHIKFTDAFVKALTTADLVVVAEQPEFLPTERRFDMAPVERCLQAVARHRPRATVILEAPAPVGYSLKASLQHRIIVIPAPLLMRTGSIAMDRAQPTRIIVGSTSDKGLNYAFIAVRSCRDPNTPYLLTNASEAEAIHAFERKRVLRGRSESGEEVADYCRIRRLNEDQVLRGLQPLAYVHESKLGELMT
ncbi:MAG: hypothetical protein ACN4F8_15865 [Hydrogenophaga sp.]